MEHTPDKQITIDQFAALYPFDFDDFQIEAIAQFLDGDSVMVAAPTGTGKTIVAEFGVYEAYRRRGHLHHADQGTLQPEISRSPRSVR